jgi:hypothetical protein
MSGLAENRLKFDRFTHHSDENMLDEFHNGARHCCARSAMLRRCASSVTRILAHPAIRRRRFSRRNAAAPVKHWSERLDVAHKRVDYRGSSRRRGAARPPPDLSGSDFRFLTRLQVALGAV